MTFEYYNPSDDKRSCVVRTMTKLTGKDYDTVKSELAVLAKKLNCETYNDERVFGDYMKSHGIFKIKEYSDTKVGELELGKGTYCVYTTDKNGFYHLIPVVDDVIYDRRDDSRDLYVIAVYKKRETLYLKPANYEDIEKEWLFQRDIPADANSFINDYYNISREDFDSALDTMIAQSEGKDLPDGYVPQTVYYLWDGDAIVGTFHLRHHLCESLINGSGHIGYYIAPEFRGKGCGTEGLRMVIEKAEKTVPEDEIYLRVNKDNPASLRVMLNNGGYIHHEDEIKYYVRIKRRNHG